MKAQRKMAVGALVSIIGIMIIAGALLLDKTLKQEPNTMSLEPRITLATLKLTSTAFTGGGRIPDIYTCRGQNISPPLQISGAPSETKSLALIMHDPDSPGGSDWLHWTVWNMAPQTSNIEQASFPAGSLQGKNDFGKIGYGGPCPGSGTHKYYFDLYALDKVLDLPAGAQRSNLENAMADHVLNKVTYSGSFSQN